MDKRTCFVIIGYGEKVDPVTQRRINLDRVFENIIQPAFDLLNEPAFDCFRACDKNYGGVIDVHMYKWIMEADFVIADISTLNPNAIYELGIRHALRPYSTIVIAEDGIREFPFDISHVKIEKYKHLGEDIGVGESKRFIKLLVAKIQQMLNEQACDSPVYTFIQKLKPPFIETPELEQTQGAEENPAPAQEEKTVKKKNEPVSLAVLISKGEQEMKVRNYKQAIRYFTEASSRDKQNLYLKHKMILATYLSGIPDKETALMRAKTLLEKYFILKRTLDRNILELAGDVYLALAEMEYEKGTADAFTKAKNYARQSDIAFHKAYVLADDLVMGTNYAYVLMLQAVVEAELYKKYRLFTQSVLVWQRIYNKFKALDDLKKEKNAHHQSNPVFLEKMLLALTVLATNENKAEREKIKTQLNTVQDKAVAEVFEQWAKKLADYTAVVRQSLVGYHPEAFI